jgi:hypothetical protein
MQEGKRLYFFEEHSGYEQLTLGTAPHHWCAPILRCWEALMVGYSYGIFSRKINERLLGY